MVVGVAPVGSMRNCRQREMLGVPGTWEFHRRLHWDHRCRYPYGLCWDVLEILNLTQEMDGWLRRRFYSEFFLGLESFRKFCLLRLQNNKFFEEFQASLKFLVHPVGISQLSKLDINRFWEWKAIQAPINQWQENRCTFISQTENFLKTQLLWTCFCSVLVVHSRDCLCHSILQFLKLSFPFTPLYIVLRLVKAWTKLL